MLIFNQLKFFLIGLFQVLIISANSQVPVLLRSTFGTGGGSVTIYFPGNKIVPMQCIGQSSVAGSFLRKGIELRQGFIQPLSVLRPLKESGNMKISVWPNPFSSEIFLKINPEINNSADVFDFRITDLAGKTVYNGKISTTDPAGINLGFLHNGIYFLNFRKKNCLYFFKIIKE